MAPDAAAPLIFIVSLVAGGIATITGFGIGSLLTPTFAFWADTRLAVAAVSIPHLLGTAIRFWLVRGDVDRGVLRSAAPACSGEYRRGVFRPVVAVLIGLLGLSMLLRVG